MKFLYYFTIICLILSIVISLISMVNIDITEEIPFIWILHIGIFIVLFPVHYHLKEYPIYEDDYDSYWKLDLIPYFKHTTKKMRTIVFCCLLLGIVCLTSSLNSTIGSAEYKNGEYFLTDHGRITKKITRKEFNFANAKETGILSGIWIIFYGIGYLLLYQIVNEKEIESTK